MYILYYEDAMNKLYFWLNAHKWRIVLCLFISYCVVATFGKNHSYLDAFIQLCGLYSATWMGTMAFLEKNFYNIKKEAKEIADRITR